MCNLYRMSKAAAEVARLFNVELMHGGNAGEYVYPGHPGWVVGQNHMATMHWGFPLVLKGKAGQPLKPKPVNNTRSDKLSSPFWRPSFEHRRCLIPMTAFAEAEGAKGHKTRTWLSLPNHSLFGCAGIWRDSDEWGPVYSMIVTEPSEQVRQVHDRMPVILAPRSAPRMADSPDGGRSGIVQAIRWGIGHRPNGPAMGGAISAIVAVVQIQA